MYRTIVVGCDGSPGADEAVALAQQLRAPDGRLVLVSAFMISRGYASPVAPFAYADWLKQEAEQHLHAAEKGIGTDVEYEQHTMAAGSAAEALDDVARRVDADLIVIGPSHRSALARFTGRCTVQRMLHGAPCAVAVASSGQNRRFGDAPGIAVAYDGSPESEYALDVAYDLAVARSAAVRLCIALQPITYAAGYSAPVPDPRADQEREELALRQLATAAERAPDGVDVETRLDWGQPVAVVLRLAASDTDLVVTGSRGFGPLRRVLAGSTSIGLIADGGIPVLVTPRAAVESAATAPAAVAEDSLA